MEIITLDSSRKIEVIDITARLRKIVAASGVSEGAAALQSLHTTAGLTINENADPSVKRDMEMAFARIAPDGWPYTHGEGNSPAHIAATLSGPSLTVLISGGDIVLGTWQGVFFCEFDGPRRGRKIAVQIIGT